MVVVDLDECSENKDDCLAGLAICTNTIGSFICTCISGYQGDGHPDCSGWVSIAIYISVNLICGDIVIK